MDLAVMRDLPAIGSEDHRRIVKVVAVALGDAAGVDGDAVFLGKARHQPVTLAIGKRLGTVLQRRRRVVEKGVIFREHDQIGLLFGDGLLDERLGALEVRGLIVLRVHLDERYFQGVLPAKPPTAQHPPDAAASPKFLFIWTRIAYESRIVSGRRFGGQACKSFSSA